MIRKNEPLTPSPRCQTRVLFVCWGNICRSTAAQFIFEDKIAEMGIAEQFFVDSAATSTEEIGNGIYPPMYEELKRRGIGNNPMLSVEQNREIRRKMETEQARQITSRDYEKYDYILIAEPMLARHVAYQTGPDRDNKVHCLMEWAVAEKTANSLEISDPWYTRNFSKACDDVTIGCEAFLRYLGFE